MYQRIIGFTLKLVLILGLIMPLGITQAQDETLPDGVWVFMDGEGQKVAQIEDNALKIYLAFEDCQLAAELPIVDGIAEYPGGSIPLEMQGDQLILAGAVYAQPVASVEQGCTGDFSAPDSMFDQNPIAQLFEAGQCTGELSPDKFNVSQGVSCGYVTVPTSHYDDTHTGTLRLAVAIVHSSAENPAPDPVIYLNGGPASYTLASANHLLQVMEPVLATRDVILFDQRGVGFSEPGLECPDLADFYADPQTAELTEEDLIRQEDDVLAACNARWQETIDLAVINTIENAADVRTLVETLGYEQVNLFGGSYGTRLGQMVMREHPEIVRSAVLDSVGSYTSDEALINFLGAYINPFDGLFAACAADASCNERYPDLEQTFLTLIDELNVNPATLEIENEAGEMIEMQLTGDDYFEQMRRFMYDPQGIAWLPYLISEASHGNILGIDSASGSAAQWAESGFSTVAYWAYLCNQGLEQRLSDIIEANPQLFSARWPEVDVTELFTPPVALVTEEQCANWGQNPLPRPELEDELLISDLPTLVLAGQFDLVTPPYTGQDLAANLANGFYVEVPYAGHGAAWSSPCVANLVADFLNDPTTAPDTACFADLEFHFE